MCPSASAAVAALALLASRNIHPAVKPSAGFSTRYPYSYVPPDTGYAAASWALLRIPALKEGCLQIEAQRGMLVGPPHSLLVLDDEEAVAELRQLELPTCSVRDVPELLHRSEPLPTQELGSHYRGENDPTNPHRAFYPDTVEYMSPARLEEHRVVAVDGRLYWADDGSRLDTAAASTAHSGGGRAMFVMDEHGNLYVSLEQRVGELHHSSFLSGRPVAGAGELVVVDGVPTVVSRKSGHYRPTEQQQEAVRDVLDSQGVDVSGVTFESGFGP